MIRPSFLTHGIRSSRSFQTSDSRPRGLSTRRISGSADVVVEPVEALRADHHVVGVVGGGDLLRAAHRGAHAGQVGAQDLEHRLVGVGGVHVVAERDQLLGELAGAGAELEHGQRLVAGQPGGRLRRVAGPAAVVGVGHPAEGPGLALTGRHRSSREVTAPLRFRRAFGSPCVVGVSRRRAVGVRRRARRHRRDAPRPRAAPDLARADRRVAAARRARQRRARGVGVLAGRGARGRRATRSPTTPSGSRPSCCRWRRCSTARRCRRWPGCTRWRPPGSVDDDQLGRPRDAESAARLRDMATVLTAPTEAPALLVAAVVHAELLTAAPFASHNGIVARATERLMLVVAGRRREVARGAGGRPPGPARGVRVEPARLRRRRRRRRTRLDPVRRRGVRRGRRGQPAEALGRVRRDQTVVEVERRAQSRSLAKPIRTCRWHPSSHWNLECHR